MGTSYNCFCQCPCPHGEPPQPPASAGHPLALAGRLDSASRGVTALFLCVLVHTRFCVENSLPRVGSLFPPFVEVLQSNSAGLQSQIPREFLVSLLDLQAQKPDVGLRTFTTE